MSGVHRRYFLQENKVAQRSDDGLLDRTRAGEPHQGLYSERKSV